MFEKNYRLAHYMAKTDAGEYFAILDHDDRIEDFRDPGYIVSGVFRLLPLTSEDNESVLPISRTLVEER